MEFETTITEVREAPAGDTLPGLHLDAKVDGRATDIYIAPMDFVRQFEVSFAAGDSVWVTGSRIRASGKDIVLAREISTGLSNRKTLYLRDSHGPFWSAGTGRQ